MTLPLFDAPVITEAKPPSLRPYQQSAIARARAEIAVGKELIAAKPENTGAVITTLPIGTLGYFATAGATWPHDLCRPAWGPSSVV